MKRETKEKNLKKENGFWSYFLRNKLLYIMVIPMIVYFLVFNYYPMTGLQLAFKDWDPWKGIWGSPWATTDGAIDIFKHFRELFFGEGTEFWVKFGNTIRISLLKTVFGFPVPIILAVFFNEMRSAKIRKGLQTVSYLPHFISWVILGGIFLSMGAADSDFELFIEKIFGRQIYFFNDSDMFLVILVISNIWKGAGWGTIIYFAALSGVPSEQYEAAEIDGASNIRVFVQIIVPQAISVIIAIWILSFIGVWNDFSTPYLYLQSYPTISLGLKNISDEVKISGDYPKMFATILVTSLPMIILFLIFQKKIMQLTLGGGLKG